MSAELPPQMASSSSAQEMVLALLKQNTPVCFQTRGPSMTPSIRDQEPVQVRSLQPGDLRCGAILLCRKNGRLILHRLIRQNPATGELWLTGDAALSGLDRVSASDLVGLATGVHRANRTIPLNTRVARWHGRLRYFTRPIRRFLLGRRHDFHTCPPPD